MTNLLVVIIPCFGKVGLKLTNVFPCQMCVLPYRKPRAWRVQYVESLHGHTSIYMLRGFMPTPCQSRIVPVKVPATASMLPLRCHRLLRIALGKSCKLFCHLNALARFLVSPYKHFICTFTRRVSKSTPSCVSQWMRRILFECQLWVYVAASCRGFDTLRAQTRSSRMRPARPWLYRIWESTRFRTASCFYRSRIYKHPARQHTVDHVFC